jgi:selenocysteine-specific elongation factor
MKKIVIGTAGHIDHGKTALIKALTGIDCDRLKEEKERGITTELGFAHFRLSDDLLVGIVDVPGHEKFVRHMVAGAWGIDMVLLVVAADEGVMPQTREHVDICELLGLKKGIVAVTKTDLADEEMRELVTEDIVDFLEGRALEGAPIIPVSAATGENIVLLRETIRKVATSVDERPREGIFRLPVDRVFTLKGLGTIVTGTCISGSIAVGEEVEIYPLMRRARVRSIQVYHEDVREALAGQRTALNLQGLEREEIPRGAIIARPGTLMETLHVDTTLKYLKLPLKPIKTDTTLRFHVATTQEEARCILLTQDSIEPGEELFVQFVFSSPIVALPGDRYVLRAPYAIQTVGGGTILDIAPARHKRKSPALADIYRTLSGGDLPAKAEYHMLKGGFGGLKRQRLSLLLGTDNALSARIVTTMAQTGSAVLIGKQVIHASRFDQYKEALLNLLSQFCERNPQKAGMSKEELRTRLPEVEPQVFQAALDEVVALRKAEVEKDKVRLPGMRSGQDAKGEAVTARLLDYLQKAGYSPEGVKELAALLSEPESLIRDVLERLVFEGKAVKVKSDLFYHPSVLEDLKQKVLVYLREHREMTPSDFKTTLSLSRKYMIPLLEYLDGIKVTIRVGDKRVLRNG